MKTLKYEEQQRMLARTILIHLKKKKTPINTLQMIMLVSKDGSFSVWAQFY